MTKPVNQLLVRVVKEFGYYDDHRPGETFYMALSHVTECIQKGYVEIVVNNYGENTPIDRFPDATEYLTPAVVSPFEGEDKC